MGLEPITDALQEHCSAKLSYVGSMIVFAAFQTINVRSALRQANLCAFFKHCRISIARLLCSSIRIWRNGVGSGAGLLFLLYRKRRMFADRNPAVAGSQTNSLRYSTRRDGFGLELGSYIGRVARGGRWERFHERTTGHYSLSGGLL